MYLLGNDHELTTEDFQNIKSPTVAFSKLSSKMEEYFSHVEFSKIRRVCLQTTRSPGCDSFSEEFSDAISNSKDLNKLLDVLAESNYWSWIDLRIMETMVVSLHNTVAERTFQNYKEYVSALKLEDVLPHVPVYFYPNSKFATVEDKCSNTEEMTVGDILKHWYIFNYEVCGIKSNSLRLCSINTGCLQLLWSIPRECASDVYKSALVKNHKFEDINSLYLKIEYYPTIYSPKYSPTGLYAVIFISKNTLYMCNNKLLLACT